LERTVHICNVSKAYQQGMACISLSIAEPDRKLLGVVVKVFKEQGPDWKVGIPPRISAEKAVQQLLTRLGTGV